MPTSSASGTSERSTSRRICDKTAGAILQPQPPPCEKRVRRSGGRSGAFIESGRRAPVGVTDDRAQKVILARTRTRPRVRLLDRSRNLPRISSACVGGAFLAPGAGVASSPTRAREGPRLNPTDIRKPDYFHKVVDCQWACPAHTPVPEYIRLIAAGRYGDAYLVNWKSNVFPGILGRTCDRPCEPACRRGRVEKDPVAICRLKRVAADYKEDIRGRLPKPAAQKNGKR